MNSLPAKALTIISSECTVDYAALRPPERTRMDTEAIVQNLDAEISRLEKARALLTGHTAPLKRGVAPARSQRVSAEGRARIAAAQRRRWAAKKK
jgi:hypothetical protein